MKVLFTLVTFLFLLAGCDMDREIDLDIPDFDPGFVVECYIAPDRPFGLLITKSYRYFDLWDPGSNHVENLSALLLQGTEGSIKVNGKEYPLRNQLRTDPFSQKIYNYILEETITFQVDDRLELKLHLPTGEDLSAYTSVPPIIPIDSVVLKTNDEGEIKSTTYMTTKIDTVQYLRRQLFRKRAGETVLIQEILTDNKIASDGFLGFGAGYEFLPGDTLISRITNLTREYYDFYKSTGGSVSANAIPFTQPGKIISNIQGSEKVIGVFAGFHPTEKKILIE